MRHKFLSILVTILIVIGVVQTNSAQETNRSKTNKKQSKNQIARPITIPITIRPGKIKVSEQRGEVIEAGNLKVRENGQERTILSIRNTADSPLHLAVLIQEDVDSTVNLELEGIANFIRRLPRGSRVMVGYIGAGTLQVRQKFTEDLDKAAKSLRVISGASASAPFNPYVQIAEAVDRFNNLPTGRRAMLVVSDGLDVSRGVESATPGQSVDLDRAILRAQRAGVAVYSIYAATSATRNGNSRLVGMAQGSLNKLSDDTGGRAYFSGTSTPVSFAPFLRELGGNLSRQFALTFLSTDAGKDFRRIEITSDNPDVKIEHPQGISPK